MRTNLIVVFFLFAVVSLNAQNAKDLLDQCNAAYNKAGGITASFTINSEDTKNKIKHSQDGKALLKGNKFKVEVVDGITWFDGKTQWVYDKGADEVNISNPTGEELANVSPSVLLSMYKSGFKLNYKGEKKERGKKVYMIELIPQNKKSEASKMIINIDKATNMFTSVTVYNKDGMVNTVLVTKIQTGTNIDDKKFAFNKRDYSTAEIVDLR